MIAALALAAAATVTTDVVSRLPIPPAVMPAINYIQGAAPIRMGDDVWLLANAGHCCVPPAEAHEGVYMLADWRWWPLWGANDWGWQPDLGDHEVAYPSAVWWEHPAGGVWVAAYAHTLDSEAQPRVHVSLRMTRLDPRLAWPLSASRVVHPLGPLRVWGVFPVGLIAHGPTLHLWAWDYTAQRLIRYTIDAELRAWIDLVASQWEAAGPVAPMLSDIAAGQYGELYALEGVQHTGQQAVEWVSYPTLLTPAGLRWSRTGRTWEWPGHTVFDCGFVRDHTGRRLEPVTVVCNTSPGGSYADSGLWQLRWWADPGAVVPAGWSGRAVGRRLR